MDAPNLSATPTFASRAPLHIGAIGLIARDLDRLTSFYRDLLGLTVLEHTARLSRLGVGPVTLIEIENSDHLVRGDRRAWRGGQKSRDNRTRRVASCTQF